MTGYNTDGDESMVSNEVDTSVVAQRVFSSQMKKVEQNQMNNLFQTHFVVKDRRCRVIIDGESSNNIASLELIEKLGLTTQPHPCPYYIQWVNSCGKIKIDKIARIEFFIGSYKNCVNFDIVPMQACHLLLSKPWISTNNALHNTIANSYSFKYNGRRVTLKPMSAAEILEEDQQRL